jgi:hypothetical protein
LLAELEDLQQLFDDYFRAKELHLTYAHIQTDIQNCIAKIQDQTIDLENVDIAQRIQISLNNIQSSLCHVSYDEITPVRLVRA